MIYMYKSYIFLIISIYFSQLGFLRFLKIQTLKQPNRKWAVIKYWIHRHPYLRLFRFGCERLSQSSVHPYCTPSADEALIHPNGQPWWGFLLPWYHGFDFFEEYADIRLKRCSVFLDSYRYKSIHVKICICYYYSHKTHVPYSYHIPMFLLCF